MNCWVDQWCLVSNKSSVGAATAAATSACRYHLTKLPSRAVITFPHFDIDHSRRSHFRKATIRHTGQRDLRTGRCQSKCTGVSLGALAKEYGVDRSAIQRVTQRTK